MKNEFDFIENILKQRRRSPKQHNEAFSSDAEIVSLGESVWAITVDEFSPSEDFLKHDFPETIGWNMAVATLSDLFACGVKPDFFMQAMVVSQAAGREFYERLMSGVFAALEECSCFLLGGDTGRSEEWRYTGIALGQVEKESSPVSRKISTREPLDIYLTGDCGDANAAIFKQDDIPRFEMRLNECGVIRKFASACIDTSGGFCDALWNLKRLNPGYDFEIDVSSIPYNPVVKTVMKEAGLPFELALIGGAGEYELLTVVPARFAEDLKNNTEFTRIGTVSPAAPKGRVVFSGSNGFGEMSVPPPCYRFCDERDYLTTTLEYYRNVFHFMEK
jgi:thiamine-monophosphate kinase